MSTESLGFPTTTDLARLRRYREYLDFYQGRQWLGAARPGERRITFNYARGFVHKCASYLMGRPLNFAVPPESDDPAAAERAKRAEEQIYLVYEQNDLASMDLDTAIDAAVLGDGAFKITWDPASDGVSISSVDMQSLFAWWVGDDFRRLRRVCQVTRLSREEVETIYALPVSAAQAEVVEEWTDASYSLYLDGQRVRSGPNPYGFIPYVIFPNVRRPREFWGESDLVDLLALNRELNQRLSVLSQILEVSGNPIAVLENVESSENIVVGPGALWELPEKSKAYLLDLLQGGGVRLHMDYVNLLYRVIHDLAETPRTAFGEGGNVTAGVALEIELQPLLQKVERKRAIWSRVVEKRNELTLRLLEKHGRGQLRPYRSKAIWSGLLPQDRAQMVANEVSLVNAGIHSHRTAMDVLGIESPEKEIERVVEEAGRLNHPVA